MDDAAARTLGRVTVNGIELAYETFGDASAPPVVLIMGLAMQMIAWPDELPGQVPSKDRGAACYRGRAPLRGRLLNATRPVPRAA
jgi:pimeloyl-ACP methyl ester carboxylesterase